MPKEKVLCDQCGSTFLTYLSERRYSSKFCSYTCSRKGQKFNNHFGDISSRTMDDLFKYLDSLTDKTPGLGPNGDCWEWRGSCDSKTYGKLNFKIPGLLTSIFAHRASLLRKLGSLNKNLCACHTCDNPPCVNPKHLFEGTRSENNRDQWLKGRHNLGTKNGNSRLSEKDVFDIRKNTSNLKNSELAKYYSVSQNCIWTIRTGRSWRHL